MSLAVTYLVCDGYLAVSYGGLSLAVMYICIVIYSVDDSNRTLLSYASIRKSKQSECCDKDRNQTLGLTNFDIQVFEH